ncbi:MAG: hypothetical protein GY737_04905 [Desulfobacteraceae bacterium]|nr:hypothetical protein [Desulfobacteraceae bacterium]
MFGHYQAACAHDFRPAGMTLVKRPDNTGQRPHDIYVAFQYSTYPVFIPDWDNHPKHISLHAGVKTAIIQKNPASAVIMARQPPIFMAMGKGGQFSGRGNHDPVTVGEKYFTVHAGHDYLLILKIPCNGVGHAGLDKGIVDIRGSCPSQVASVNLFISFFASQCGKFGIAFLQGIPDKRRR